MTQKELKEFLDLKATQYNQPEFLSSDPIQIPHRFERKEDIEIAGFLTASIAWGNRKSIINSANKMMDMMGNAPYDFVMSHSESDLEHLEGFVHRTFNSDDLKHFIRALNHIYRYHGGMEKLFAEHSGEFLHQSIHEFKKVFFDIPHLPRTQKHVSDPLKNSAAKRIHMYLRWMVRDNSTGVDFGLWKSIHPRQLSCPLDVHTGNIARRLGILKRKQNDFKTLTELDTYLRKLDPEDPVKYDFALFGLGAFEKF